MYVSGFVTCILLFIKQTILIFCSYFCHILFILFSLLHGYEQLSRASSNSSLSSNDSGTPIDIEGPIDESHGLGYHNSNFQVLNYLFKNIGWGGYIYLVG